MNTSNIRDSQRLIGYSQGLFAHSSRELTLECSNLRNHDLIVIRTQNNLYRFLLTDAKTLRGRLIGEWRKYNFAEAILVGALIRLGEQMYTLNAKLLTGAQALFLVQKGRERLQITTSPVIALGWFINREG